MRAERITYRGIDFTRYPDHPRRHLRVYYWPTKTERDKNGIKALHVEIYKAEVGPIPDGWHVHHKDENPLNNDPANLEALPAGEHSALHLSEHNGYGRWEPEVIAELQDLAKAWHGSPEGLAWHSEHGRRTWEGREREPIGACFGCGTEVFSYRPRKDDGGHRWCSRNCFMKWADRTGRYFHDKICEFCGQPYRGRCKARFCSRSCAGHARVERQRAESEAA